MDAQQTTDNVEENQGMSRVGLSKRVKILGLILIFIAALIALLGFGREEIADTIIQDQIDAMDIELRYDVEKIALNEQVLTNIVVGDPAKPDLTIERAEVSLKNGPGGFWKLGIGRLRLVRPKLYGTYLEGTEGGRLSFGALDKVIYTDSEEPLELPKMQLEIVEGRGLLLSDYGSAGVAISGRGRLDNGFKGQLAAIGPELRIGDCLLDRASAYGAVTTKSGAVSFSGPLRLREVACGGGSVVGSSGGAGNSAGAVSNGGAGSGGGAVTSSGAVSSGGAAGPLHVKSLAYLGKLTLKPDFSGGVLSGILDSGAIQGGGMRADELGGEITTRFDTEQMTALYSLRLTSPRHAALRAQFADASGAARIDIKEKSQNIDAVLSAENIYVERNFAALTAQSKGALSGTMVAPLVQKFERALSEEMRGANFSAKVVARSGAQENGRVLSSIAVPSAVLRGLSGSSLMALSRLRVASENGTIASLSGNLRTGGKNLPQIIGTMKSGRFSAGNRGAGNASIHMRMLPYAAPGSGRMGGGGQGSSLGNSATNYLAVPDMVIRQSGAGFSFDGVVQAGGALPGGSVRNLRAPVTGRWNAGGLALWEKCTGVGFDALQMASLSLNARSLTLCPDGAGAIIRQSRGGNLQIAARVEPVRLSGSVGDAPIRITSGPARIAFPGPANISNLDIHMGPRGEENIFTLGQVSARLGASNGTISGRFSGAEAALFALPLDVSQAEGAWRYVSGELQVDEANLRAVDRYEEARFEPLIAQNASMIMREGKIEADAIMRLESNQREIAKLKIHHDLDLFVGDAEFLMDSLRFDEGFRPDEISQYAKGLAANVKGDLNGEGRMNWNEEGVTSHGVFSSDGLDMAVAFGPIEGARGKVEFSDLINLTTAGEQEIFVASVNPGIEARDGVVRFTIKDLTDFAITGGYWPFMGGELILKPSQFGFETQDNKQFNLEMRGIEASQFVENMELANLSVMGKFDGSISVSFDENYFGHIDEGRLASRPPGGSVSYVGDLTYEDMGAFANYAFGILRSLEYDSMVLDINGPLAGEILTQVSLSGVRQGEGTKSNFVVRQIADIPIQFNINIRAPFYQMFGSLRSLYDFSTVRDPRELGLFEEGDGRFVPRGSDDPVPTGRIDPPDPSGPLNEVPAGDRANSPDGAGSPDETGSREDSDHDIPGAPLGASNSDLTAIAQRQMSKIDYSVQTPASEIMP